MSDSDARTGLNPDGPARKKAWSPRVRTGCRTCRVRRVKCDETRPACQRCVKARRQCSGYALDSSARRNGGQVWQLTNQGWRICSETEPPDWDFTQAVHYYFSVMKPSADGTIPEPPIYRKEFVKCRFICTVIGDQVSKASKARNRLLGPGEDPAFAGLWLKYYRYTAESLDIINQSARGVRPHGGKLDVLIGITYLFLVDMYIKASMWHAHINGYLAYLDHQGGITEVLKQPKPPLGTLPIILYIATPLNTTTPASQQILGFDNFTDAEITRIAELEFDEGMPCPAEFLIAIIHITRLRGLVARAGKEYAAQQDALTASARAAEKVLRLFSAMRQVDVDKWVEHQLTHHGETVPPVMARIYKVAIRLYAILTLPKSATLPWISSAAASYPKRPGFDLHDSVRILHREELLALLRQTWDTLRYHGGLAWPLIVAGVAASDGNAQDRDYIDRRLCYIWQRPLTAATFLLAVEKLRAFWRSGKTGWEDCFDEPTPCYP